MTNEQAVAQLRAKLAKAIEERNAALEEAYQVMLENEQLRVRCVA